MELTRLQRVSALFEEARLQPDGDRGAFLQEACADESLRREVESLLEHHSDDNAPLQTPLVDREAAAAVERSLLREVGLLTSIGQFRVTRMLGEGGMGAVYLAEQSRPKRTVALKVIRPGLATRKMLRRFEFEASVLAMLNHPGIAQIYEAGVHEEPGLGPRPFFAMEYVQGRTLTSYANETTLTTRQRLELLAKVCDAVQHAHQRGIIHRDLKPGNILVTDAGEPKILDFGVARAIDSDLQITTIQTDVGQLVGTLAYMSPEQVCGDSARLDTRADVYSLGVILYELLTGRMPHDLRGKTIAEAARVIGEKEPTPLSSFNRVFRGDLQTIVARALDRDVERRYVSAAALAEDLRRYLKDEPIAARRDSVPYVLRKRLRRYRVAAAVGLVFLVGAATFSVYAAIQAKEQAALARLEFEARTQAEAAGRQAKQAEVQAERERDDARRARDAEADRTRQAQSVTEFLVNTLGMANPDITQTANLTKQMMLETASEQISEAFPGQPEAEATVRAAIGRAYAALGESEHAAEHLWRALQLMRAFPQRDLRAEYEVLWPYVQALQEIADASRMRQAEIAREMAIDLVAEKSPEIRAPLETLSLQFEQRTSRTAAIEAFEHAMLIAHRDFAPDSYEWTPLADVMHSLAPAMRRREIPELADRALTTALEVHRRIHGDTNTRVVQVVNDLIDAHLLMRRPLEAQHLAEQSLETLAKILPENHWYAHLLRFRIGQALAAQSRNAEARALMTTSIDRIIDIRGVDSDVAVQCLRVINEHFDDGQHPQQLEHYRRLLAEGYARSFRPTVISIASSMIGSGNDDLVAALRAVQTAITHESNDLAELIEEAIILWEERLADDDPRMTIMADHFTGMSERVFSTRGAAGSDLAQRMLIKARAIDEAGNLRHPHRQANTLLRLAEACNIAGRHQDAHRWAQMTLDSFAFRSSDRYGLEARARSIMGACLVAEGRLDEAEPLLRDAYLRLREDLAGSTFTFEALDRLVLVCELLGQPDRASQWRSDAVELELSRRAVEVASLNAAAWNVVVRPGQTIATYKTALRGAQRAIELAPRDTAVLNTLAVAQFRCGMHELAIATLKRSAEATQGRQYEDWAFLALAHHELDQRAEALEAHRRFLELQSGVPLTQQAEYQALAEEIEAAIGTG